MRVLKILWSLIVGWGGLAAAGIATLYYGPRKLMETWDWYMFRFRDRAVLDVIDEKRWTPGGVNPDFAYIPSRLVPWRMVEIAHRLRRSEQSVGRSLRRLKESRKIQSVGNGWLPT